MHKSKKFDAKKDTHNDVKKLWRLFESHIKQISIYVNMYYRLTYIYCIQYIYCVNSEINYGCVMAALLPLQLIVLLM